MPLLTQHKQIEEYLRANGKAYIRRKQGERHQTSAYGISYQFNQQAKIWGFYKSICTKERIPCNLSNKSNRDRLNLVISESQALKDEELRHAVDFYLENYTIPSIAKELNSNDRLAFMVVARAFELSSALKLVQTNVGIKKDGKLSDELIRKIPKEFDIGKFIDDSIEVLSVTNKTDAVKDNIQSRLNKLRGNGKRKAVSKRQK